MGGMTFYSVFALIAGAVAGYFIAKSVFNKQAAVSAEEWNRLTNEKTLAEQRLNDVKESLKNAEEELRAAAGRHAQSSAEQATLKTINEHLTAKLQDQKKEIVELHEKLQVQFENIANKVVFDNSQRMQQQHVDKLADLLTPFRERIIGFEKKVQEANEQSIRDSQSLKEQIKGLQDLNKTIGEEAKNLTSALKGQVKTQGNWGEMILESILERSGLVKDREYSIQASFTTEDGKRLQPDVLVNLPEKKTIIIDSKVSLVAYERLVNAQNDEEREAAAKEHIASLRRHIKGLGNKNYQQLYDVRSLDFVLLFIPVEPAFSMAIQLEPGLFNEAFDSNIVLVSASTLLATLRTISSIWKLEYQNQNSREIARQSGALYDKFVGMVADLETVGKKIDDAHHSWEDAMKKLHSGRGNLVGAVQKIKKLGADTSKSLPEKYLSDSEEEAGHNQSSASE
ncbi:MAG TPA: DNA recombination protein RmuC [Bacteroidia bacterium]|nr:DNA recombination protein RmuC [Bacteroidia bacterium]